MVNKKKITERRLRAEKNSNITKAPPLPVWAKGNNVVTNMAPGTSVFDPVLCEIMYRWFCVIGGTILDPFAGGSVRGIVAAYLGYKYIGIDLSKKQVEANIEQANIILKDRDKPIWIVGNSLDIDNLVKDKVDFIFSCPPYFDLEKYSDDDNDLSNLTWEEFKKQYGQIISKSVDCLKNDRFACFVVGDIRDKKGFYRNFVGETISLFVNTGAFLYNEIIFITPIGNLPIRVPRYFNGGRKVGKTHQNVLVFYKGNPKNIKNNFKELDFNEINVMEDYTGKKAELI